MPLGWWYAPMVDTVTLDRDIRQKNARAIFPAAKIIPQATSFKSAYRTLWFRSDFDRFSLRDYRPEDFLSLRDVRTERRRPSNKLKFSEH
jgi:hypothetical protein